MRIHSLSFLVFLILAAIAIMILSSLPTDGEGLDDAIAIRSDRNSLRLEPGEEGWVTLNVSNTANVSLWVQLHFTFVDAPHHSRGTIMPEVFHLAPGESRDVSVEVFSHARLWQDPDYSDFKIHAVWGFNATLDQRENWEGERKMEFDIVDDFSHQENTLLLITVVLVIIVGGILLLINRYRRSPSRPAS